MSVEKVGTTLKFTSDYFGGDHAEVSMRLASLRDDFAEHLASLLGNNRFNNE